MSIEGVGVHGRVRAFAAVAAFAALTLAGGAVLHVVADQDLAVGFAASAVGLGLVAILASLELSVVFSIALVAAVVSGHTENLGLAIPPDRVIFAIGVWRLVWRAWLAPRAPEPADEEPPHPGFGLPHWLLLTVATYAVVSLAWAIDDQTRSSIFELVDRLGLYPFLTFMLAPVIFATDRARRHLVVALTCLGAYLGVTAIFEVIGPHALVFPRYIMDPNVGLAFGRARGPFVEGGTNGLAMHAAVVAGLMWLWCYRPPSRAVRMLVMGVVGLCVLGIFLTLTRQVWVGSALSLLVVGVTSARGRRLLLPAVASVAVLVAGAYYVAPGLREKVTQRASDQRPLWDRLNLSHAAVGMFEARPLFGWGWNGFRTHSRGFFVQNPNYPLTRPGTGVHNVFLINLVELGLVGTALWVFALIAGVGGALWRRPPPGLDPWRTGLLAVAVAWLTVANLSPLNTAFPNTVLWLWAGVVWRPPRRWYAPRPVEPAAPAPELKGAPVAA